MPSIRIVDGRITGKYDRKDPIILSDVEKLEVRVRAMEAKLGIASPDNSEPKEGDDDYIP